MRDPESRRQKRFLHVTTGLCLLLVMLQMWWSWPRLPSESGLYLLSRPSGALVTVQEATKYPSPWPAGHTPHPIGLASVRNARFELKLPGYVPKVVVGREIAFESTPSGASLAVEDLQPQIPILAPALYLARDCWLLVLAVLLAAAFWFFSWLPYSRRLKGQNRKLEILARGAVVEGVRLGSYELGQPLGRGGMGAVYSARSWEVPETGWPLALKLLTAEASQEARDRFLREADLCRGLNHRGIVRLLDWGEEAGQLYLVLERVEGSSLEGQQPESLAQLLDWARQLAAALAYAHNLELVHRDIKPSNLMLAGERLVVMDFGIAHRADLERLTQVGDALGTPGYMAIEQLRGESADYRTDLYAFGVVLYEWLTGRRPYEGANLLELIGRQLNGDYPRLEVDAPPALIALIERLLLPFPEQRAASPRQVLDELSVL